RRQRQVEPVDVEPDDLEGAPDRTGLDDARVHADLDPGERPRGRGVRALRGRAVRDQATVDVDVGARGNREALRAPHVRQLVLLDRDGVAADRGDLAAIDLELDE